MCHRFDQNLFIWNPFYCLSFAMYAIFQNIKVNKRIVQKLWNVRMYLSVPQKASFSLSYFCFKKSSIKFINIYLARLLPIWSHRTCQRICVWRQSGQGPIGRRLSRRKHSLQKPPKTDKRHPSIHRGTLSALYKAMYYIYIYVIEYRADKVPL